MMASPSKLADILAQDSGDEVGIGHIFTALPNLSSSYIYRHRTYWTEC